MSKCDLKHGADHHRAGAAAALLPPPELLLAELLPALSAGTAPAHALLAALLTGVGAAGLTELPGLTRLALLSAAERGGGALGVSSDEIVCVLTDAAGRTGDAKPGGSGARHSATCAAGPDSATSAHSAGPGSAAEGAAAGLDRRTQRARAEHSGGLRLRPLCQGGFAHQTHSGNAGK
ncbi:MAG: hypothetical protein WDZ59_07360 [Pirellulales bacterium]